MSILLGAIVKQLKTFSPIQISSSGSISSTLYLGGWGTIECRGLRATPWNTTWQRMFWFLNQIVESTDTFGTRFISDTSILKKTNLDHSLFVNNSGRYPGCFLAHKTPVECLYVVFFCLQSYPLWKNVFSGEFPPSPWKYVRTCLCVRQMTIMATVNGQTMVGHRFLCKVLSCIYGHQQMLSVVHRTNHQKQSVCNRFFRNYLCVEYKNHPKHCFPCKVYSVPSSTTWWT